MPQYRSNIVTQGPASAAARALLRATGMREADFGKPIIAVANSFTQFVPGHVHLKDLGQMVIGEIQAAGGHGKEFNTIAVDDGIAMGQGGMLYSLPSRDIIADSVEYMVNAHCADALVCISNCDKITPGMLNAALRLNIPTVFVSGGPMETGRVQWQDTKMRIDAVDALVVSEDPGSSDAKIAAFERSACPTCGSCAGMFTANSINCLTEALGLSLPGNGSLLATHADRKQLFLEAGRRVVDLCRRYYQLDDDSVLPRSIANFKAFENAMRLDLAMGGSTNTVLHLLAAAYEGKVKFTMADIDRLSKVTPHLCKLSPSTSSWYMEDFHRAGGVIRVLGELDRINLVHRDVNSVHSDSLADALDQFDIRRTSEESVHKFYSAAPGGVPTQQPFSQDRRYPDLDVDVANGCIRDASHAYSSEGGLVVLYGNLAEEGCILKTAGIDQAAWRFSGHAIIFESETDAAEGIRAGKVKAGHVVVIRYEGPKGGPGMQEMLKPTGSLKARGLGKSCALITDGRFSGGSSGLCIGHISPEAASGGTIALVKDGDRIDIDVHERHINLVVSEEDMATRRNEMLARGRSAWTATLRTRVVSTALKAYAALVTSASTGAVRNLSESD